MATLIGINGFGRIGRQVLRAIRERHSNKLKVVAVNDLGNPSENAHLFKYDSTYGRYPGKVEATDDGIKIDGDSIRVLAEREPSNLPWGDLGVEVVVESTGLFTDAGKASGHLEGGAKKVIISAPASGEDLTIVLGVNEDRYDAVRHNVLSNASCTTNCVATMVKVLHDSFGVERGLMTTVHSYTNDQKVLDIVQTDLRRGRAAAQNIIPTSTGAAKAVGVVLPELNGKIHGMAMRVPTATVSVTDFVANLGKVASPEEINQAYKDASVSNLDGILDYTDEPLVSSDFKLDPHSAIIDGLSTMAMGGDLVKVVGWYDNEWGYSCRTADLAAFLSDKGL
ncbi:type I glyceraldehyde-3-phosphate dehydrogenase [Dehalococcoidia bacterium]|nr:type I glyceraldehyde-3-phosphate dehydrogenase [Dehalococcoidia bacterium]